MINLINKISKDVLLAMGMMGFAICAAYNVLTYSSVKEEIMKKSEKMGIEYTKKYCNSILRNSHKHSEIFNLFNGGDNAAKEYLEEYNLK